MTGEMPGWARWSTRVAVAVALASGSLLGLSGAMAASVVPKRVGAAPRYPAGLKVQLMNSSGTVLTTLATFSNLNAAGGYQQVSYGIAGYAGQKVTLKFTGTETDRGGGTTDFALDDTAINVS